jgi:cation diffusion facilitator CzcD-associated flavoprotein CzcO
MQNGTTKYHFYEPIKSIVIIGAGISSFVILTQGATGIVLAKAARLEGFTSIKIFEQRSDIGGAWYLAYRDKLIKVVYSRNE